MEGIFTLPYSEYDVINRMSRLLKKKEGYGFYIPTSRQQKGVDFLIMNHNNGKTLRFQVKSSRSWFEKGTFSFWFNNFVDRYSEGNADIYVLHGLYPLLQKGRKVNTKKKAWDSIILCFDEKEMFNFLKEIKTKKENRKDKFFGLKFKESDKIFTGRGVADEKELTDNLIKNYIGKIKSMLN